MKHTFIYFFENGTIKTSKVDALELNPKPRRMVAYSAQMIIHVLPTGRATVLKDKLGRYAPGTELTEVAGARLFASVEPSPAPWSRHTHSGDAVDAEGEAEGGPDE